MIKQRTLSSFIFILQLIKLLIKNIKIMDNIKIIVGGHTIEVSGEVKITPTNKIKTSTVIVGNKKLVKATKVKRSVPTNTKVSTKKKRRKVTNSEMIDKEILRMIKKKKIKMSTSNSHDAEFRVPRNIKEVPPTYLKDKARRHNARTRLWARINAKSK